MFENNLDGICWIHQRFGKVQKLRMEPVKLLQSQLADC